MSSPNNPSAHDAGVLQAPKSAAQAVNSGDLVKVSANLIVPISAATDALHGICQDTSPVTSLLDQLSTVVVLRSGVFFFFLTAGDTVAYGDAVYATADPQIVTSSSGGGATKVGRVRELASVTGAAGNVTRIKVEFNALPEN